MADRPAVPVVENKAVELSKSGDFRKGAQVVTTVGLPDGYVPPSASVTPPKPAQPAPPTTDPSTHSGNDDK